MRPAQKAALMAMLTALEEGGEDERETREAETRETEGQRLIRIDLAALAQARAKTPA